MVKTLKRKFIAITMISVAAVFLLIMAVINIVNYTDVVNKANEKLSFLAENNGTFDELIFEKKQMQDQGMKGNQPQDMQNNPAPDMGNAKSDSQNFKPPGNETGTPLDKPSGDDTGAPPDKKSKEFMRFGNEGINEETPFESRYFTVTLSQSGEYVTSNTDNIAAVTSDDAIEIAKGLYNKGRTDGTYDDYKYTKIDSDGNIMYIFLDCKRDYSSFRTVLVVSIIVTIVGLVLVFIIANILSRIALKPVFESYAKQKRFITDASHELKTPVAIIKADVEIVEMENGESEWTTSITKQADRLTNLTEQMVMLSRMDEGPDRQEFVDVDASEVFRDVAESFEPIAIKLEKDYNVYIDSGIHIKGDEKNISRMLSLLIDNAFKYSDNNGKIDVAFHKSSKGKVLKVTNTVEEISVGSHNELFDRFYRRDESRNSKTGGFGIGLSVVQAIAESHKARITARSVDGKSIEFKVIF